MRCAVRGLGPGQYSIVSIVPYELRLSPRVTKSRSQKEIKRFVSETTHSTNTLGKGMNPIILPPAMGK